MRFLAVLSPVGSSIIPGTKMQPSLAARASLALDLKRPTTAPSAPRQGLARQPRLHSGTQTACLICSVLCDSVTGSLRHGNALTLLGKYIHRTWVGLRDKPLVGWVLCMHCLPILTNVYAAQQGYHDIDIKMRELQAKRTALDADMHAQHRRWLYQHVYPLPWVQAVTAPVAYVYRPKTFAWIIDSKIETLEDFNADENHLLQRFIDTWRLARSQSGAHVIRVTSSLHFTPLLILIV